MQFPRFFRLATAIFTAFLLAGCAKTPVAAPTETPQAASASSEESSSSSGSSALMTVTVFFAKDNGDIDVVPMPYQVPKTTAVLRTALTLLTEQEAPKGLRNYPHDLGLKLDGVSVADGTATIRLSGEYTSKGIGDDARFQEQIVHTAKQFSSVREVKIFLNGCDWALLPQGDC